MIDIKAMEDCVGCNACVQRCPRHCIDMIQDEQGFQYPKVDVSRCIECGLCEKVCPIINQALPRKPKNVYAAKNIDTETLMNSSSGGVFYALAKSIIDEGGVVFGAKFNDKWEVVHDFAETLEGVRAFQGSKYVQSRIGNSFKTAENFLKIGRKVLYTGTPCQIAGLRLFLRKQYDNLIMVDVVCHGVPSPLVWKDYLKYISRPEGVGENTDFQSTLNDKEPVITGINLRDKRLGWGKYGFSVHAVARQGDKNSDFQSTNSQTKEQELLFEPHYENLYMQIFLKDLDLRPSCYACPSKSGKSGSYITLADFWGIKERKPEAYNTNGVSLVLVNTNKGKQIIEKCNLDIIDSCYSDALEGNPAIEKSALKSQYYNTFWELFSKNGIKGAIKVLDKMKPSLLHRALSKAKRIISIIFPIKNHKVFYENKRNKI